ATDSSSIGVRTSARASTNSQRARTPASPASSRQRSSRSRETSLKITLPPWPTRSSAPNAIRPSPQPTSSIVSPEVSAALSSTRSRTGARYCIVASRAALSPPCRRSSSHAAHLSRAGALTRSLCRGLESALTTLLEVARALGERDGRRRRGDARAYGHPRPGIGGADGNPLGAIAPDPRDGDGSCQERLQQGRAA